MLGDPRRVPAASAVLPPRPGPAPSALAPPRAPWPRPERRGGRPHKPRCREAACHGHFAAAPADLRAGLAGALRRPPTDKSLSPGEEVARAPRCWVPGPWTHGPTCGAPCPRTAQRLGEGRALAVQSAKPRSRRGSSASPGPPPPRAPRRQGPAHRRAGRTAAQASGHLGPAPPTCPGTRVDSGAGPVTMHVGFVPARHTYRTSQIEHSSPAAFQLGGSVAHQ